MVDRVSQISDITVPVTAIVTAYQRIDQTIDALRRIMACHPTPDEILVHVDGKQSVCANAVRAAFPQLTVIMSEVSVGPGGGRNKLIAAASNELIASFDDDSYPIDDNYFSRVWALSETFPDAALFAANVFHRNEQPQEDLMLVSCTASFGAGGVVFRRSEFLAAGGFVPLVVAYGMEEEDLTLRLLDRGRKLMRSPWLRVFHDTDLSHHASARITSGVIANLALLAWLRYPVSYWPYGVLQIANRILWCLRAGRHSGVLTGLLSIPRHLARHSSYRSPVSKNAMRHRFAARRYALESFKIVQDDALSNTAESVSPMRSG